MSEFFNSFLTKEHWQESWEFYKGYGDAVVDTVSGLAHIVRHPVDTAKGIKDFVCVAYTDPRGTWDAISSDVLNSLQDPRSAGKLTGHVLITAGTVAAPFASSAKTAQVANEIAIAERAGSAAQEVASNVKVILRVRHHTSVENMRKIQVSRGINPARGDPIGVHVETQPFGPVSSASRDVGAFGRGAYIEFDQPQTIVPTQVGPRNTGVIPTHTPLSIENLHPVFYKVK